MHRPMPPIPVVTPPRSSRAAAKPTNTGCIGWCTSAATECRDCRRAKSSHTFAEEAEPILRVVCCGGVSIRVTPSQVPMPKISPTTCVLRVCGRIASTEGFASGPHQPVSGSGAGRCCLSPWVVVLAAWVALDLTPPEGLGWLLRQDSLTSC
jgi:hypothetical protein